MSDDSCEFSNKHSTAIIDDLINATSDWRSIDDIVRLAFKALTDVVRVQGQTLQEIERQLPTRAGKQELAQALFHKVNIVDIQKSLNIVQHQLDKKMTYEEFESIFKENLKQSNRNEQNLDNSQFQELKYKVEGLYEQFGSLNYQNESFKRDMMRNGEQYVNKIDLEYLRDELDNKVGMLEFNEQMEQKISKTSIENMLNKKVSKKEVQQQIANEIKDIIELVRKENNEKNEHVSSFCDDVYVKQSQYKYELEQLKQSLFNISQQSNQEREKKDRRIADQQEQFEINRQLQDEIQRLKNSFDELQHNVEQNHRHMQECFNQSKIETKNQSPVQFQPVDETLILNKLKKKQKKYMQVINQNFNKFVNESKSQLQTQYDMCDNSELRQMISSKVDFKEVQEALDSLQSDYNEKIKDQGQVLLANIKETEQSIYDKMEDSFNAVTARIQQQHQLILEFQKHNSNVQQQYQQQQQPQQVSEPLINLITGCLKPHIQSYSKKVQKQLAEQIRQKSSIDHVNKALESIHSELDQYNLQMGQFKQQQSILNESLCSENILSRFMCSCHNLKQGNLIQWDQQIVNTLNDNFLWEVGNCVIHIVTPGIYNVRYTVWGKRTSKVDCLVNSQSYQVNGIDVFCKQSIIASNYDLNIQIKANSKISLVFRGELVTEAILQIKRL